MRGLLSIQYLRGIEELEDKKVLFYLGSILFLFSFCIALFSF